MLSRTDWECMTMQTPRRLLQIFTIISRRCCPPSVSTCLIKKSHRWRIRQSCHVTRYEIRAELEARWYPQCLTRARCLITSRLLTWCRKEDYLSWVVSGCRGTVIFQWRLILRSMSSSHICWVPTSRSVQALLCLCLSNKMLATLQSSQLDPTSQLRACSSNNKQTSTTMPSTSKSGSIYRWVHCL